MSRVIIIEDGVTRVNKIITTWDGTPPPTKGKAGAPQNWTWPMRTAIQARIDAGIDVTLTLTKINSNYSVTLT